jgi:hypothetical protein
MTREEAIKNIKEHCYFANLIPQAKEALNVALKVLEQEPCDKCVYSTKDGYCQYDDITEAIPPFEPFTSQPKTGHWEWVQYDSNLNIGNWHCSECKNIAVVGVKKNEEGGIPIYKYCPNCGAKMVETQESEE